MPSRVGAPRDRERFFVALADGEEIHGGNEVNHMALRLKSGEFKNVKALVEERDIEVTGRSGDPHCIYFSDPDGHRLQLLTPREQ